MIAEGRQAQEELGRQLLDELRQLWEAAGQVAVVGDGAPWIWETASWLFPRAVRILDWYHLS